MKSILFVDFGSGHHRDAVSLSDGELVLQSGGARPFEHAGLLADLVAPYPELRIVFSMFWERAYGPKEALPPSLQGRVIGSLYEFGTEFPGWAELSRREQIQRYVDRHYIHSWLALERDCSGWPGELHENVVCLGEGGLDSSSARKELVEKLARMHAKEFQRICSQHSWTVDMLAAYEQIEGAAQKLTEAASAPEHATRLQAGKDAILSCGTAIAAGYSIDVAHKRESLALTFLAYALAWDDSKRAAIEQLLKSPTAATPANPAEIIDLAEATLQETQNWFQTTAREAYEH
ncbi:HAD domain-containing protein [Cupriavidus pinatubonensis]|nr:HAD domain-containing protein [Cupriavidus pinatubonensis]